MASSTAAPPIKASHLNGTLLVVGLVVEEVRPELPGRGQVCQLLGVDHRDGDAAEHDEAVARHESVRRVVR